MKNVDSLKRGSLFFLWGRGGAQIKTGFQMWTGDDGTLEKIGYVNYYQFFESLPKNVQIFWPPNSRILSGDPDYSHSGYRSRNSWPFWQYALYIPSAGSTILAPSYSCDRPLFGFLLGQNPISFRLNNSR